MDERDSENLPKLDREFVEIHICYLTPLSPPAFTGFHEIKVHPEFPIIFLITSYKILQGFKNKGPRKEYTT